MRINTIRLRVVIGILGMSLAWIVIPLIGYVPASISETWYTNACTVFMIILGWASGILVCYKGYDFMDDVLLTCSGLAGFGICLFPCAVTSAHERVGPFLIDNRVSNSLHFVFAIVFFVLLAYNSLFLFTKSDGEITPKKKARNIIFRVCGIGMVVSFAILLIPNWRIKTWFMEMVALTFFGVSFLTKANVLPFLFCDRKPKGIDAN